MHTSFDPVSLFGSYETFHPSFEEMFDRWERNFLHHHEPKSNPVRELNFELMLSPAQAMRGGSVPIEVPIASVCPRCQGSGVAGFYDCDLCDGRGMDWRMARVDVLLSPPVRDGSVIDVPLRQVGVRNFILRVRTHVAA